MIRSSFCAIVDLLICWRRGGGGGGGGGERCRARVRRPRHSVPGYCISSERDKNFSPNLGEEREGAGISQQKKALVLNLAY